MGAILSFLMHYKGGWSRRNVPTASVENGGISENWRNSKEYRSCGNYE